MVHFLKPHHNVRVEVLRLFYSLTYDNLRRKTYYTCSTGVILVLNKYTEKIIVNYILCNCVCLKHVLELNDHES